MEKSGGIRMLPGEESLVEVLLSPLDTSAQGQLVLGFYVIDGHIPIAEVILPLSGASTMWIRSLLLSTLLSVLALRAGGEQVAIPLIHIQPGGDLLPLDAALVTPSREVSLAYEEALLAFDATGAASPEAFAAGSLRAILDDDLSDWLRLSYPDRSDSSPEPFYTGIFRSHRKRIGGSLPTSVAFRKSFTAGDMVYLLAALTVPGGTEIRIPVVTARRADGTWYNASNLTLTRPRSPYAIMYRFRLLDQKEADITPFLPEWQSATHTVSLEEWPTEGGELALAFNGVRVDASSGTVFEEKEFRANATPLPGESGRVLDFLRESMRLLSEADAADASDPSWASFVARLTPAFRDALTSWVASQNEDPVDKLLTYVFTGMRVRFIIEDPHASHIVWSRDISAEEASFLRRFVVFKRDGGYLLEMDWFQNRFADSLLGLPEVERYILEGEPTEP